MRATAPPSRTWSALFFVLLLLQIGFWYGLPAPEGAESWLPGTRHVRPTLHVIPPVPTFEAASALGLGDHQSFFRVGAFRIQNAGDGFGQVTPLKAYNYAELYRWWQLLDRLDAKSNFVPAMVSYYFGATQDPKRQVPHVVRYLEEHAARDPEAKWWWYHQAAYLARHRLEDDDWALRIAYKLADLPEGADVPLWTRQMPAFILEKQGEYKQACEIILNILDSKDDLTQYEINFILHFINDRIAKMVKADKDRRYDQIDPRCYALVQARKEGTI